MPATVQSSTITRLLSSRAVLSRVIVAGLIAPALLSLALLTVPPQSARTQEPAVATALRTALEETTLADRIHESLRGDLYAGLIAWSSGDIKATAGAHSDALAHAALIQAALKRAVSALAETGEADIASQIPGLVDDNAAAIATLIGPNSIHPAEVAIAPFTMTWQRTRAEFATLGSQLENSLELALSTPVLPTRSWRWLFGSLALFAAAAGLLALSRLKQIQTQEAAAQRARILAAIAQARVAGHAEETDPGLLSAQVAAPYTNDADINESEVMTSSAATANATLEDAATEVTVVTNPIAADTTLPVEPAHDIASSADEAEASEIDTALERILEIIVDDDDANQAPENPDTADDNAPVAAMATNTKGGKSDHDAQSAAHESALDTLRRELGAASIAAQTTTELGHQARIVAESSRERLADLLDAMQRIASGPAQIDAKLKVVEQSAFRANVLALNTDVEAARLGEPGRSLAIIATECRTLAHQTMGAAAEVREQLAEILAKASESGDLTEGITRVVAELSETMVEIDRQATTLNGSALRQQTQIAAVDAMMDKLGNELHAAVELNERHLKALEELERLA